MAQFFYFGVRRTRITTDATGRSRNEHIIVWGRKAYPTKEAAIRANIEWWCKHPDEDPIVRGFDKELEVSQDGTAKGFKQ